MRFVYWTQPSYCHCQPNCTPLLQPWVEIFTILGLGKMFYFVKKRKETEYFVQKEILKYGFVFWSKNFIQGFKTELNVGKNCSLLVWGTHSLKGIVQNEEYVQKGKLYIIIFFFKGISILDFFNLKGATNVSKFY